MSSAHRTTTGQQIYETEKGCVVTVAQRNSLEARPFKALKAKEFHFNLMDASKSNLQLVSCPRIFSMQTGTTNLLNLL